MTNVIIEIEDKKENEYYTIWSKWWKYSQSNPDKSKLDEL